jgi:hypothetical protein
MTTEEIKKLLKELIEIDLQHTSSDYARKKPARVKEIEHELYIVGVLDVNGAFIYSNPYVDELAAYYWKLFDMGAYGEDDSGNENEL